MAMAFRSRCRGSLRPGMRGSARRLILCLAAGCFGGSAPAESPCVEAPAAISVRIRDPRCEYMLAAIRRYGFTDETVLAAMARVPRHQFISESQRARAYDDSPLPIGYGQTISQPYIVAEMTRQLQLTAGAKVLEVGTGSGYQAAVLAEITDQVFTIEIIEELARSSEANLKANGYDAVQVRHADGYFGWEEEAPYDAIIVTCAAGQIPPPLIKQLKAGGRMIIPVGKRFGTQTLILATRNMDGTVESRSLMLVRFVPLTRL